MQKVLIGIIVAAILLTIPSIYERVQVEESNKTVETIVPYKYIYDWMIQDPELEQERIFNQLQESGVDTISLEFETLNSLHNKGELTIINVAAMNELLIFNQMDPLSYPFNKKGLFVYTNGDSSLDELITSLFEEVRQVTVQGVDYTFLFGEPADIKQIPLGYNQEVVDAVLDAGLQLVPRIANWTRPEDTERMVEELLELKQPGVEKVLFSGNEVPFFSEPALVKDFSNRLDEAGYAIFSVEFAQMDGLPTVAYTTDMDVVRLHSQSLTKDNAFDVADKFARAAQERNIRAFFVNAPIEEYEEAEAAFTELNNEINDQLPGSFERGQSELYETFTIPLWQIAIGLIGSIAFLAWAAQTVFGSRKLTYIAIGGLALLALAYLVTDMTLILKIFALGLAVATPIAAVLLKKNTESKYYLIASYFKAVGVTLVGIWLIVVLLNGSAFILGIDAFRGVKLVYILPILFLVLYALWGNMEKFIKSNVAFWHVLVIALAGAIVYFYIDRSGNTGSVLPYEVEFRMFLEELLYVRPRTKEFLIGLPIFVLALEMAKKYRTVSYYLLIPAVIGFLSMVNTFTHFHIPLSISLLRTGYSVVLGLLIGLILVFVYRWVRRRITEELNRRAQA